MAIQKFYVEIARGEKIGEEEMFDALNALGPVALIVTPVAAPGVDAGDKFEFDPGEIQINVSESHKGDN